MLSKLKVGEIYIVKHINILLNTDLLLAVHIVYTTKNQLYIYALNKQKNLFRP